MLDSHSKVRIAAQKSHEIHRLERYQLRSNSRAAQCGYERKPFVPTQLRSMLADLNVEFLRFYRDLIIFAHVSNAAPLAHRSYLLGMAAPTAPKRAVLSRNSIKFLSVINQRTPCFSTRHTAWTERNPRVCLPHPRLSLSAPIRL